MISFVILCKNEGSYLKELIPNVQKCVRDGDEILIIDDFSDDVETVNYLDSLNVNVHRHLLNGDFSSHRNYAHQFCKNDWIFMIDADEKLSDVLIENLHEILLENSNVDLFQVPRLNFVDGMSQNDISKWGWRVSNTEDGPVINFPDYQGRIYKNRSDIVWRGRLHERVEGFKVVSQFPPEPMFSLIHKKTIDRQTKQNEFYNKNFTKEENMGVRR